MTFTGIATRQILAADAVEDAGRIETRLLGRLDYEIWHNLVMNFALEYTDAKYVGIARRDTTVTGRIGLDYYLNENWLLSLGYEHSARDSTDTNCDMSRNRVTVGAKLRF